MLAFPGISLTSRSVHILLAALLILMEAAYLLLYSAAPSRIVLFVVISLIASCLYLAICVLIRTNPSLPRSIFWCIVAAAVLFRLTLIGVGPIASGDVYRYLWEGKVQVNGYNPYAHAPIDTSLNHLHSTLLPGAIEFGGMPSIYPPVTEWIFAAAYALFGETVTGIKALLFLAEMISFFLIVLILKELGRPPTHLAFYALCPLAILQFMVEGHIDAAAFPLFLMMLLFWIRRKKLLSFIMFGASILSKLMPAILLPVFWREGTSVKEKLAVVCIPLGAAALVYGPYLIAGGNPWQSIMAYSSRWYFNGLLFDGVLAIMGSNEAAHIVMMTLFPGWLAFIAMRRLDPLQKIFWIFMGFFVLSATVHPWYILWIAILLPFVFSWSAAAWLATINLANIVYIDYLARKAWHFPISLELLEYLPVIVLLIAEVRTLFSRNAPC